MSGDGNQMCASGLIAGYNRNTCATNVCNEWQENAISARESSHLVLDLNAEYWRFPETRNPRIFDILGFNPNIRDEQYWAFSTKIRIVSGVEKL